MAGWSRWRQGTGERRSNFGHNLRVGPIESADKLHVEYEREELMSYGLLHEKKEDCKMV